MDNSSYPTCPLCKNNNSSVKLPDLIFTKMHTINLEDTSDYVKQREITSIELINQLMLPPAPNKSLSLGIWRIPLVVFGIYIFIGSCGSFFYSLFFLVSLIWGMNTSDLSLNSISKNPNTAILIVIIILACIVGLISLISSVFLTIFYFSSVNRASKKIKANSDLTYPLEKQAWDLAKKVWSNLYYCTKDNVVFEPDTEQIIEPENTRDFIFNRAKQRE